MAMLQQALFSFKRIACTGFIGLAPVFVIAVGSSTPAQASSCSARIGGEDEILVATREATRTLSPLAHKYYANFKIGSLYNQFGTYLFKQYETNGLITPEDVILSFAIEPGEDLETAYLFCNVFFKKVFKPGERVQFFGKEFFFTVDDLVIIADVYQQIRAALENIANNRSSFQYHQRSERQANRSVRISETFKFDPPSGALKAEWSKRDLTERAQKILDPSVVDAAEILAVQNEASPDQLKKAFRQLVTQFHPDKYGFPPSSPEALVLTEMSKKISLAYSSLLR